MALATVYLQSWILTEPLADEFTRVSASGLPSQMTRALEELVKAHPKVKPFGCQQFVVEVFGCTEARICRRLATHPDYFFLSKHRSSVETHLQRRGTVRYQLVTFSVGKFWGLFAKPSQRQYFVVLQLPIFE